MFVQKTLKIKIKMFHYETGHQCIACAKDTFKVDFYHFAINSVQEHFTQLDQIRSIGQNVVRQS